MAKVFISYSHDIEQHKKRVRDLAEYLPKTERWLDTQTAKNDRPRHTTYSASRWAGS